MIEATELCGASLSQVQEVEIPRNKRGQIQWRVLEAQEGAVCKVIEAEVRKLLARGISLNEKDFKDHGAGGLVHVIKDRYPGRFSELRTILGVESVRKPNGYWNAETIKAEAKAFFEENRMLTQGLMVSQSRQDLIGAIASLYPGGLTQLKTDLGIKLLKKPIGYWDEDSILKEASAFLTESGQLTPDRLIELGRQDLLVAATSKYPGKLRQLKQDLGMVLKSKPVGYWTPERIREETLAFYQQEGRLTQQSLVEKGRADLVGAIGSHYPGKMFQLNVDLGIQHRYSPVGYWTPERTRQEAEKFYKERGTFSRDELLAQDQGSLVRALAKYPGGMNQLRADLGLPIIRKDNYWTKENIFREAQEFYTAEGVISFTILEAKGRKDLISVIRKKYPGGINQIRTDLGSETNAKPMGYWTPERIREEALLFYEQYGKLSTPLLRKIGRGDLLQAIMVSYKGAITQLKIDLAINQRNDLEIIIPSDEAEEEFRKAMGI